LIQRDLHAGLNRDISDCYLFDRADCIQYVRYYSKDNLGNEEAVKTSVQIRQKAVTLAEALDNAGLTWTTGGNAAWFGQRTVTYDGVDAAQSGDVSDSQSTWMETSVTGPGTLTYYWKISSESDYDYLSFYLNGALQSGRISGNVDWQQKTYELPSGNNVLRWIYSKDSSVSTGSDAGWVDQVVFTPTDTTPPNPPVVSGTTPTTDTTRLGPGRVAVVMETDIQISTEQ